MRRAACFPVLKCWCQEKTGIQRYRLPSNQRADPRRSCSRCRKSHILSLHSCADGRLIFFQGESRRTAYRLSARETRWPARWQEQFSRSESARRRVHRYPRELFPLHAFPLLSEQSSKRPNTTGPPCSWLPLRFRAQPWCCPPGRSSGFQVLDDSFAFVGEIPCPGKRSVAHQHSHAKIQEYVISGDAPHDHLRISAWLRR